VVCRISGEENTSDPMPQRKDTNKEELKRSLCIGIRRDWFFAQLKRRKKEGTEWSKRHTGGQNSQSEGGGSETDRGQKKRGSGNR